MALPASGPLTLQDIQTEFGGSNPIGLNEYYAGGGLVPPGTSGTFGAVPSSGAISIQNFYGTSNISFISATGGTVTTDGDYKVHTFTGNGSFVVSSVGSGDPESSLVDVLAVGGGGGGGARGGGGGAGNQSYSTGLTVTATSYTVTVGAGGAGSAGFLRGSNGTGSTLPGIGASGAPGGAPGGCYSFTSPYPNPDTTLQNGSDGIISSGGGGATAGGNSPSAGIGGPNLLGGGFAGGNGSATVDTGSGGGGGAGGVGAAGGNPNGGNGGNGLANSITGSSVTRSGGGGGGSFTGSAGSGGSGGGGNGGVSPTPGAANTGGGGGGSSPSPSNAAAAGGSGVLIIRYRFQA
jgi:hypothetical protein